MILKAGSTVWYGAVLRGDDGTLTIGENSNVQDNAVLHCDVGGAVMLGKNVTVGHSALVHGCTVGDGSLIGMHATLLNHCVVGKNCIIGAGALVPEGMVIPDGSVAVGVPARVIKQVSPAQIEANLHNAAHYVNPPHPPPPAVPAAGPCPDYPVFAHFFRLSGVFPPPWAPPILNFFFSKNADILIDTCGLVCYSEIGSLCHSGIPEFLYTALFGFYH